MSDQPANKPASRGALDGLRVIDASRVLGGPYAGQVLADHGADVIKVEPPGGDETRGWGPPFDGDAASYFIGVNRNKRGIAIDFAQATGQQLLLELLADADVFLENFKIGTLERWGLGGEALRERFPRLIHCRVSGFGADGPYGAQPGYDAAVQARCGIMSVNGEAGGGALRVGVPVIDLATGQNAVIGILLALHERQRSGQGQMVEATLYDSGLALLHPQLANYYLSGQPPGRSGNQHPNISPYDAFDTRSTQIFLAVGNHRQFVILCRVLGRSDLPQDPRFASNAARNQHRELLRAELTRLLAGRDCEEVARQLIEAGVPCAPVRSIEQVVADPHTLHREMIVEVDGYRGTGSPIKLSRTPASYVSRPPRFAQHTDAILRERGLDPETYAEALPRQP